MKVRLFKPSVGEEELSAIREVFDDAWLGLGPRVGLFEKMWGDYIGTVNNVGVNSGTAALHLALSAFGFKPGSKVLVPALTFISTASAVLANGLEPIFVDSDLETLSISMDDVERKFSKDCVAIMPVHYGGHPAPMEKLLAFARSHGLAVIEDCAHCAGGAYKGKKLGSWGDIGCFSFEEKKSMTTGDGGMISSNDTELLEPLRAKRWVGIDKDTWRRTSSYTATGSEDSKHWYYEISELGFKYNMNDLMACIGIEQLKKLDSMNERRRQIIRRYLDGIQDCEKIRPILPYELDGSSYWIFGVRCSKRDDLILHLKNREIATGVHYMPVSMHPLFASYDTDIPVLSKLWDSFLTLPLFPDLSEDEVDYVIDALVEFDKRL